MGERLMTTPTPTPTPMLADQAQRARIEGNLRETLFVEAGAGTGKTHELVQRIVNLIADDRIKADQIAAITFTNRAAAELYDRVLEELDKKRNQETDPQRQQLFADAASDLDAAAVETLHAFAGRILRLHLVEAGLPPGFEVVDEPTSWLRFRERWSRAMDEMLADEALAEAWLLAFEAGVELQDFETLARTLHNDWDRAKEPTAVMHPVTVDTAGFIRKLDHLVERRWICLNQEDTLYRRLDDISKGLLHDLHDHEDELGYVARSLKDPKPTFKAGNSGRKANWPDDIHVSIRQELAALDEERTALRQQIVQSCCAPIFNAIRRLVLDYAEERRREGKVEFSDLLVRASMLVETNPQAAQALHRRFERLLIDEFQDNDPLQTSIIDAISQGQSGRAFYVGDPKQSIYRFRRADIQQFNSVKRQQQPGLTHLTQNFRSVPGVIDFVNAVFGKLMTEGGPDQAEWDRLEAHRKPLEEELTRERMAELEAEAEAANPAPPPLSDNLREGIPSDAPLQLLDLPRHGVTAGYPAVTVVGEEREEPMADVREREGRSLAALIASVVADRWLVKVKEGGRDLIRPARLKDIAVLAPSRTGFASLLEALEDGNLPYRLESRSLVYDTAEVRELLNLLRTLDDPTDQVALVAALHGPAFACADDDLLSWHQARGRWDYRQPRPERIPADHPVAEAMAWLQQAAARRWELSVSELVGMLIRERRLLELSVLERQPREHWQRYRFLHDQARAFCDAGGSTVSEFLDWAQHQQEADTRVIESVVPEEDHDAVRIMTIHAAKGLEFPVVVFTGLNIQRRNDAPPLLWDEHGKPEIRLRSGVETNGYAALWEQEQELLEQETVRRNYVGATRARDHLIISLYRKPPATKTTAAGGDERGSFRQEIDAFGQAFADTSRGNTRSLTSSLSRYNQAHADLVETPILRDDAQRIAHAILETGPDHRWLQTEDIPNLQVQPTPKTGADDLETAAEREAWLNARATQFEEHRTEAHYSATTLLSLFRQLRPQPEPTAPSAPASAAENPNQEPNEELPPWRRGRAGTAIGRAAHAVLQLVNLEQPNDEEIERAAQAQATAESLTGEAAQTVARLTRRAVHSPTIQAAAQHGRYWRELYAAVEIEGTLLDGFIDLLYEDEQGSLTVLDYKTDALQPGEATDAAVERYRLQAAAYALIVQEALGKEVAQGILYFLEPDEARQVPDLKGAMAEVRSLLKEAQEAQEAEAAPA